MRHSPILVEPDDPKFLEEQVDLKEDVANLGEMSADVLLESEREYQTNFDTAPFDPDGRTLRFYPGGYTVWSGFEGSGKTTLLRQLICHLIHVNKRNVFVASMEQSHTRFIASVCKTAHGKAELNKDNYQWCLDYWQHSLRVYTHNFGIAKRQMIFAIIRVLAREQGVRHAIIDSLMTLDLSSQDWEEQRQFAVALAGLAYVTGTHIHLVAHPKKPQKAGTEPTTSDVGGASDIARFCHNVLFVQRGEPLHTHDPVSGMTIKIKKQREWDGYLGSVEGFFHRPFKQFKLTEFAEQPTRYLPGGAYGEYLYTDDNQMGAS